VNVKYPPRVHVSPRFKRTFGDLAGDLAQSYGLTPDDWQRLVLDDWLAVGADGQWLSLTCGLAVPRQNGKNGAVEVRELFGMVGQGEKFLHTAHEVKTARKAFKRLKFFFGEKQGEQSPRFPELNGLVDEVRNVNGQEAIFLTNGGSVEIVARSKGSGRGYTVDTIIFDECQELTDDELEALLSTNSAAPLGNPQWIYLGTPPGPKVSGEVFNRVRNEAMSGKSKRLAWHEWSAEGDVDLDDEQVVRSVNPGLETGRLQFTVIEGERANLSDEGFARERLGMWSTAQSRSVIDVETWNGRGDTSSLPTDRFALSVDVSPDRSVSSVGFAGQRPDGLWHVELDEQRGGVGWVAAYVAARCEANEVRAVVIDGKSPAASIIDELKSRGVKVTTTSASDMGRACGSFYDGAMEGWLAHIDQPQLNLALSVARKRPVLDMWAWNRKNAASDITPLVAVTLALWGAQASAVKRPTTGSTERRVVVLS